MLFRSPITYTWGVTGTEIVMEREEYGHRDEGLAGIGGTLVQDFLSTHYDYDLSDPSKLAMVVDDAGESAYIKATSLLLVTEEEAGALDLADMAPETGGTLTANLSGMPLIVARSVKLVMYEQLESSLWQMMTPSRLMQVVELRYRGQYDDFFNPGYPDLVSDDYRFITYLSYLSAHAGLTVAMAQDGQILTAESPNESQIGEIALGILNATWAQEGYYLPSYMAIATGLGDSLSKLRSSDWFVRLTNQQAPGFIDEFAHLTPDIFAEAVRPSRLQIADKWMGRINMVFGAVVGAATLVMNVLQMACGSGEDFRCGNEKAFSIASSVMNVACAAAQAVSIAGTAVQMAAKTLQAFKGITVGLAVVGTVIGIGVAWVAFGLAIAGSDSPVVIKAAVALVIVTTIWLIFMFAINFIPVVGQIISAILCLIDTLVSLITGFIFGNDSW